MDVAPDSDLYDFIESLDVNERKEDSLQDTQARVEKEEEETDIWQAIADALDNWSGRILGSDILHENSEIFRCAIEASLYRQQLDGILSTHDISELRYIADLWIRLLHSISCYTIGCQFVKRDIITLMLELYTLKQLDRDSKLFIDCCLKI